MRETLMAQLICLQTLSFIRRGLVFLGEEIPAQLPNTIQTLLCIRIVC